MTPAISRSALPVLAAALILSLAACDKKPAAPSTPGSQAQGRVSAAEPAAAKGEPSEEQMRKLNAYTEAYNKFIGSFGLHDTRKSYFEKQIANRNARDSLSISTGRLDHAVTALKQARALPGTGAEDQDKAADGLMAALEPLMKQLAELDIYYESKAYKEDNLAKGKAQDAAVRAGFDASVTALAALNDALEREHKKRDEQLLATLKAEGNMRLYNIKLGLQQAEQIVNLFAGHDDLAKPEKYTQGDVLVAELDKTLAEQRKANAEMGTKDANAMNHEGLTSHLTALVGAYRELKQSQQVNAFNDMVHKYNAAVGTANAISQ